MRVFSLELWALSLAFFSSYLRNWVWCGHSRRVSPSPMSFIVRRFCDFLPKLFSISARLKLLRWMLAPFPCEPFQSFALINSFCAEGVFAWLVAAVMSAKGCLLARLPPAPESLVESWVVVC